MKGEPPHIFPFLFEARSTSVRCLSGSCPVAVRRLSGVADAWCPFGKPATDENCLAGAGRAEVSAKKWRRNATGLNHALDYSPTAGCYLLKVGQGRAGSAVMAMREERAHPNAGFGDSSRAASFEDFPQSPLHAAGARSDSRMDLLRTVHTCGSGS